MVAAATKTDDFGRDGTVFVVDVHATARKYSKLIKYLPGHFKATHTGKREKLPGKCYSKTRGAARRSRINARFILRFGR